MIRQTAMTGGKNIEDVLISKGSLTEVQARAAADLASRDGIGVGPACVKLGFVTDYQLAEATAELHGLEFVTLEESELDDEALNLIPAEMLHRAGAVPVRRRGEPFIVTADPSDIVSLDRLERIVVERGGKAGRVAVAPRGEVEGFLNRGSGSVRILRDAAEGVSLEALKESAESEPVLTVEKISADSSPVVRLVDTIIFDAITRRSSDIHLESGPDGLAVKYRIDGVLHRMMEPVDRRVQPSIISRVKVMSELDISERRVPQDGRFKLRIRNKTVDFRVSIMPGIHGEDAVIRILDKEHLTREFEELRLEGLGIADKAIAHLRRMIREPYGMLLVTGPTGSGKTTTLYAALSEINTGEDKIITIEDPVEYQIKGIIQIAVNEKKGLTFARGLRSILRHDPDKIMVGEIRDAETAQIAIQAALTGHLVFTTVHANNVFDVIGRFTHMGIEPYNFVSSLNCVLAQRLIRLVCQRCKRAVRHDEKTLLDSGIDPALVRDAPFCEGAGCPECHNTGYSGRRAVVELLDLSDEIKDLIASKEPLSVIKKKAFEDGMLSLRQAAVECVLNGETTLKEINRVTFVE